jgi:hypothetical protein
VSALRPLIILGLIITASGFSSNILGEYIGPLEYKGYLVFDYPEGENPIINIVFTVDPTLAGNLIIVNVPSPWSHSYGGGILVLGDGSLGPGGSVSVTVSLNKYFKAGEYAVSSIGTTTTGEVSHAVGPLLVGELVLLNVLGMASSLKFPLAAIVACLIVLELILTRRRKTYDQALNEYSRAREDYFRAHERLRNMEPTDPELMSAGETQVRARETLRRTRKRFFEMSRKKTNTPPTDEYDDSDLPGLDEIIEPAPDTSSTDSPHAPGAQQDPAMSNTVTMGLMTVTQKGLIGRPTGLNTLYSATPTDPTSAPEDCSLEFSYTIYFPGIDGITPEEATLVNHLLADASKTDACCRREVALYQHNHRRTANENGTAAAAGINARLKVVKLHNPGIRKAHVHLVGFSAGGVVSSTVPRHIDPLIADMPVGTDLVTIAGAFNQDYRFAGAGVGQVFSEITHTSGALINSVGNLDYKPGDSPANLCAFFALLSGEGDESAGHNNPREMDHFDGWSIRVQHIDEASDHTQSVIKALERFPQLFKTECRCKPH